jgi:hypothetical protein
MRTPAPTNTPNYVIQTNGTAHRLFRNSKIKQDVVHFYGIIQSTITGEQVLTLSRAVQTRANSSVVTDGIASPDCVPFGAVVHLQRAARVSINNR